MFLLVLLIWLSALLLAVYSASAEERLVRRSAQQEALRLSQLAASYQEQVVRSTRELLTALAQLPIVREPDPAACRPLFVSLVQQYSSYTNLFVVDMEGNTYCSALESDPTPEAVRERSWFQRALEVRDFSQGDYAIGLVSRRPVITFSYPIFEGQRLDYIVAASVDLAWVGDFIAATALPPGVTITAIDRNATVLYVYPEAPEAVGQAILDPSLTNVVRQQGTGTIAGPGLDGDSYLFGFSPLSSVGTTSVLVGIPGETVSAVRDRLLLQNIFLLAGIGILTLSIAWFGARSWLLEPLQALFITAQQLSSGDLSARVNAKALGNAGELNALGSVFNEMANSLQQNETALQNARDDLEQQVKARTAALTRSEHELRLITDSLPVLISYVDTAKRYQFNNRTHEEWFHQPSDSLQGKQMWEVFGEDAYQVLEPYIERALRGESVRFETRIPNMLGGIRHIDSVYTPDFDENGAVIGIYVLVMDISVRKQIEEKNNSLVSIMAAFSQALSLSDVADVFLREGLTVIGAHTAAMFLLTPDEGHIELVSQSNVQPDVQKAFTYLPLSVSLASAHVIRTGEGLWFENSEQYKALFPETYPTLRRHQSNAAVYLPLISRGRIIGSISIGFIQECVFDEATRTFITALVRQCAQAVERAKLYDAESKARVEAERASAARLKFLAMVSHVLRTPLTTIKGFSSTLLATDVEWEPENQHRFIELIDEEANRLTELIDQLLDLSRIQAGTLRIHPERQHVETIIQEARSKIELLTQSHQLLIEIAPALPPILADRLRITHVLVNLVENSVKYSPRGTSITITMQQQNGFVCFQVKDEGIGIPQEEREMVFEAFRQVERKERAKGAGLGLAICKGLILAHGGSIWVEDRETTGTTIAFTLPVDPTYSDANAAVRRPLPLQQTETSGSLPVSSA
ncbi:MAG: ATP-binding protein [bacterium]|nr:ATP-binding protein [bacterium]